MFVEKYVDEDFEEMCRWFEKRKLKRPTVEMLSQHGAIVPGVAAGFLYMSDGNFAYIDFYITNPQIDRITRYEALQAITETLIKWAKQMEFNLIMANTQNTFIAQLAMANGFKNLGKYTVLMKELN